MRSLRETSGDPVLVLASPCKGFVFTCAVTQHYKKHRRYEPTQNDNKEEEELLCLLLF